jgi:hypothetical protein
MGQINFIWGLIGENLSLGAYFRLIENIGILRDQI